MNKDRCKKKTKKTMTYLSVSQKQFKTFSSINAESFLSNEISLFIPNSFFISKNVRASSRLYKKNENKKKNKGKHNNENKNKDYK